MDASTVIWYNQTNIIESELFDMRKWISLLLAIAFLTFLPAALAQEIVTKQELSSEQPTSGFEGLYINEVMASNQEYFTTSYGTTPDWIELYNSTDADMDLSGLWLSDSKKVLNKFIFPQGTLLKAKGFLVVYASGVDGVMEGDLHAAFKLSADGESVSIYNEGVRVDALRYGAQTPDISYARNDEGKFEYTSTPTIGEPNVITPPEA